MAEQRIKIEKIIETAKDGGRFADVTEKRSTSALRNIACLLTIDVSKTFQKVEGFGGALTESSAYVLSLLDEAQRTEVLHAYFGSVSENGNGYTLARTHLNSCDFSLENWSCLPQKDETLETFDMSRSDKYIVPLITDAAKIVAASQSEKSEPTKSQLKLLVSPWSPPAWMKDNNDMNHGGKLLRQYYELWAACFARFLEELDKRGIATWAVSVQNEPEAAQTWDSCLWTGAEEGEFVSKYLASALEEFAKKIGSSRRPKILVWDHNRDRLWARFQESIAACGGAAASSIDGAAYHWYSGDQYENVMHISEKYPEAMLVFTEGCVEGGARNGAWFSGERYAHNIINDLNSGCTAWIDWNIALDLSGGPNHVGNLCDSPVLVDTENKKVFYQSSFYYIAHFSRYIKPGAVRIALSVKSFMTPATVDGRAGNMMEFCAFKNPDKTIVVVALNRTEADMVYAIQKDESIVCLPRAIQTVVIRTL